MDTLIRVADPPLFPHCDVFSHTSADLVDTRMELFTLDDRNRPIVNRMYLSLDTAEQIARAYGKTLRDAQMVDTMFSAVTQIVETDWYEQLAEENRSLRSAIAHLVSRRGLTKVGAEAVNHAIHTDELTPETVMFLKALGVLGA